MDENYDFRVANILGTREKLVRTGVAACMGLVRAGNKACPGLVHGDVESLLGVVHGSAGGG